LRLVGADWRRPITRLAESITVIGLWFGAMNIAFDVGRIDRSPANLLKFGRFQSPLLWDVVAVSTYIMLATISLYVALIPDLAHMRDRTKSKSWRRLYSVLSLNWGGTKTQWIRIEKALLILAILVVPTMVLVHTVVSYVFSMSVQPMWHESIFGPFFVAGALHSGVALILVIMYLLRRFYHLENLLTLRHFDNMGKLLIAMAFIWLYLTGAEHLTAYYGAEPAIMAALSDRVLGRFSPIWVFMMFANFVIPAGILLLRRTPGWTFIAGLSVVAGMWVERLLILIPTLENPRLPYAEAIYTPTWVEYGLVIGSLSFFALLYYLFTKFFPIIPIWEVKREEEKALGMHNGGESVDEAQVEEGGLPLLRDGSDKTVRIAQYALLGFFLFAEFFVMGIILNGIRNGILFGIVNREIADWASLGFSIGVNSVFLPIHIGTTYAVGRLAWFLIREGGEAEG
ncbi:MAG: NrfD/PsrC family molybdoenzyme membrane anchor subunit, partial [Candidatus Hydrothermarchaeaceae archaeon]